MDCRIKSGNDAEGNESGGFCCQVPPNPACRSLSRQDFKYRYCKPLTRPALPEHSCRWQLWIGPSRRYHTGQKHVLYALVDPVSAPPVQPSGPPSRSGPVPPRWDLRRKSCTGGAAGYCPRVR